MKASSWSRASHRPAKAILPAAMGKAAALLAAALLAAALGSCGGGGAEPGAPEGATLVLDFQPNAVHAGSTPHSPRGLYEDAGIDLDVREPSASSDAPKLLESGRAQFAILDIHDLGTGARARIRRRRRGADRPAAARRGDRGRPRRGAPTADLVAGRSESRACHPTTPCSTPSSRPTGSTRTASNASRSASTPSPRSPAERSMRRRRSGTPREWHSGAAAFRRASFASTDYGAPRYPELVLVTTPGADRDDPRLVEAVVGRNDGRATGWRSATPRPRSTTCSPAPRASTATSSRRSSRALEPALSPVEGSTPRCCEPGRAGTPSTESSSSPSTSAPPSTRASSTRPRRPAPRRAPASRAPSASAAPRGRLPRPRRVPRLGVGMAVEAEHRHPEADHGLGLDPIEVGDQHVGVAERRLGGGPGERRPRGRRRRAWPRSARRTSGPAPARRRVPSGV